MRQHKYYKLIKVDYEDTGYFYIKNVGNETGEFNIANYTSGTLEYSTDGVNWSSYDLSTKPSISVNPNSNIYLRGTNFKFTGFNNNVFNFTKDYIIGGNFYSAIDYSTMSSVTTLSESKKLNFAFRNQTHLLSAEKLNFGTTTTIDGSFCFSMFYGCTSLTTPPDMSNFTTFTGESSCGNMFYGCTSLTTAPDLSNLTSIGFRSMGDMFNGCTSLTTGCDLSSVVTITNNTNCLDGMYRGCTKISTVTTPNIMNFTNNNILNNWLADSAGSQATGIKVVNVPTGATITTDSTSGIPSGWTRVDY